MATWQFDEAIRTFQEIKNYRTLYAKHMPQGDLISSAIEHLLYLDNGVSWLTIYGELVEELQRIQKENVRAGNEEKRVQNYKIEQCYHDLTRQFQSKHEKSKLMRPANQVLMTCFVCERYRIPYCAPIKNLHPYPMSSPSVSKDMWGSIVTVRNFKESVS